MQIAQSPLVDREEAAKAMQAVNKDCVALPHESVWCICQMSLLHLPSFLYSPVIGLQVHGLDLKLYSVDEMLVDTCTAVGRHLESWISIILSQ